MKKKQTIVLSLAVGLSITASFLAGMLFQRFVLPSNRFGLLSEAYSLLIDNAYDAIPDDPTLEYGMIRGMLEAFNEPYTVFVEPSQHELQSNDLQGSFGGIGARISVDTEGNYILFPIPDGPADVAGVMDNDFLIKVDDYVVSPESSIEDILTKVRGPEGAMVKIDVWRVTARQEFTFKIERGKISLPSVTWHLAADEPRLGVVEINIVAASTVEEITNAVQGMQSEGATHFVLDLRGNRGGLLEPGIDIANMFLDEGTIIERQYRGEDAKSFQAESESIFADLPIIVLVNTDTASAAEIIAGALHANNRALLVGEQTFGKDSIQLVFELRDSSSIHVTTAKWWFPNLAFPTGEGGLIPDITVAREDLDGELGIALIIEILFGDD